MTVLGINASTQDQTHDWTGLTSGHEELDTHLSRAVWGIRDRMIDARKIPANEAFADELEHLADVARTLEYYERGLLACECLPDRQPCAICRAISLAEHPNSFPYEF